jgi:hypothetical protein
MLEVSIRNDRPVCPFLLPASPKGLCGILHELLTAELLGGILSFLEVYQQSGILCVLFDRLDNFVDSDTDYRSLPRQDDGRYNPHRHSLCWGKCYTNALDGNLLNNALRADTR